MNQGSREELELLYPWYKEEVFRRRERMMWLTACTSGVLLLGLLVVQVFPAPATSLTTAVLVCRGIALFSVIIAYLLVQQQTRHLMAKRGLIKIEQELRCYETGLHLEEGAMYR